MPRRSSLSLPPRLPLASLFLLSFAVPVATGDKHLCFVHGYSQQCQVLGQDPSSLPRAGGLSGLLESLPVFPMSSAPTSSSSHIQNICAGVSPSRQRR
ncbi:hypothetical protein B0H19DRAFT_1094247, partial [Mycena capillaripes]